MASRPSNGVCTFLLATVREGIRTGLNEATSLGLRLRAQKVANEGAANVIAEASASRLNEDEVTGKVAALLGTVPEEASGLPSARATTGTVSAFFVVSRVVAYTVAAIVVLSSAILAVAASRRSVGMRRSSSVSLG